MSEPIKEQIQWLWEQCGLVTEGTFRKEKLRYIPKDLNNLFKYPMPKLNFLWGSRGRIEFYPGKGITTCYIHLSSGTFEGVSLINVTVVGYDN